MSKETKREVRTMEQIEYLYKPTLRPAGFATLPVGLEWDYIEAPSSEPMIAVRRGLPMSRWQFGIIATNRRLTTEEREHFGLAIV